MDLRGLSELQIKWFTLMYDLSSSFYMKVYTSQLPYMVSMHTIKRSIMTVGHWQPLCDDPASAHMLSLFDSAHWHALCTVLCIIYRQINLLPRNRNSVQKSWSIYWQLAVLILTDRKMCSKCPAIFCTHRTIPALPSSDINQRILKPFFISWNFFATGQKT